MHFAQFFFCNLYFLTKTFIISVCEYLRNFSDRMEGTEAGMVLALPTPSCNKDGAYEASICITKKILVTRAEKRQIIERNNIRQMKALLRTARQIETKNCPLYKCIPCPNGYEIENGCQTCKCKSTNNENIERTKRDTMENLRLHQVIQNGRNDNQLDVKNIIRYLRQNIMTNPQNDEAHYLAEILSRKLLNQVVQERNAKVIDIGTPNSQNVDPSVSDNKNKIEKTKTRKHEKVIPTVSAPLTIDNFNNDDDLVEVEVDECWCVDGFGTEIPNSRGFNVSEQSCQE